MAQYRLLFILEHNHVVHTDIMTNQTHVSYRK